MTRALFLDRDGVINVDHGYVCSPERTEFIDGIFQISRYALSLGYKLIICTNQAGIARGYYTEAEFKDYMAWMEGIFLREAAPLAGTYYCPHHPQAGLGDYLLECNCRKPKPGMLISAAEKFGVDLATSVMVGDKESDVQAGQAAGVGRSIQVHPVHSAVSGCWEFSPDDFGAVKRSLVR